MSKYLTWTTKYAFYFFIILITIKPFKPHWNSLVEYMFLQMINDPWTNVYGI